MDDRSSTTPFREGYQPQNGGGRADRLVADILGDVERKGYQPAQAGPFNAKPPTGGTSVKPPPAPQK